jgi:hypothetical protein
MNLKPSWLTKKIDKKRFSGVEGLIVASHSPKIFFKPNLAKVKQERKPDYLAGWICGKTSR